MTSCCQTCFNPPLVNWPPSFSLALGGQGESVTTQNVASDQEKNTSDQDDHLEGGNFNSEGDPADTQGISRLDSLRMTEEEERVFNTFSLAPVTVPKRSWRAHEDLKDSRSHSQAHDVSNISQTRPVITQVVVQAQSTRSRSVQSDQRSD